MTLADPSGEFKERSCRNALNRSHQLQERSQSFSNPFAPKSRALVKIKMVTANKHTAVLAAILSHISHDSDTNFIYILIASKCQQCNNEEHFKNKTPNEITVITNSSVM